MSQTEGGSCLGRWKRGAWLYARKNGVSKKYCENMGAKWSELSISKHRKGLVDTLNVRVWWGFHQRALDSGCWRVGSWEQRSSRQVSARLSTAWWGRCVCLSCGPLWGRSLVGWGAERLSPWTSSDRPSYEDRGSLWDALRILTVARQSDVCTTGASAFPVCLGRVAARETGHCGGALQAAGACAVVRLTVFLLVLRLHCYCL